MGTLKYSEAGSFEEMAEKVEATEVPNPTNLSTAEMPAQDPGVAGTVPVETNETTE